MNILEFFDAYPDEDSCRQFFKNRREQRGLICDCCRSSCFYWIDKEHRWKCKGCGTAISLKKEVVMEHSNFSYKVWLWCLYLISLTKKGFSALEMQRLLEHSRYESIWLLMHKIRISMGHRDDKYTLYGYIEMDEGFFEGHRKQDIDGNPAKELDRQVKAVVAVSTQSVAADKSSKHHPDTKPKYVKMSIS